MTQTEFISKRLDGKIEVITGGNSGIGLATAQRFVQEGAYVFITGRRQDELDKAVKQIGRNVTAVQGDVSNLADLDLLYETVKQQGKIDVLFANADLWEFTPLEEITETHFDKIFSTNVKGLLFTVQKTLPLRTEVDHSDWLGICIIRVRRIERLQRDQGCDKVICTFLDGRSEPPQDLRQHYQPGSNRHTCRSPHRQRTTNEEPCKHRTIWKDGQPRRSRKSSRLPCIR